MKYQGFVKNRKIKMGGAGSNVVWRRRGGGKELCLKHFV